MVAVFALLIVIAGAAGSACGSAGILCGDAVCDLCCNAGECRETEAGCFDGAGDAGRLILRCDGPEDCLAGETCCAGIPGGSFAIVAACETIEPWFAAYIAVCAFAGLRRGEASALKVSDVDFMRRELQVQRQVQWNDDGTKEIRPPKYGSERTVFAPDDLLTMLSEHIRLYRPGDDPDRWLFPGSRNAELPAHSATVNRWWRIVRAHIGIDNRLHDLRHFYASGLISAGCDVVTVQRAMGHIVPHLPTVAA